MNKLLRLLLLFNANDFMLNGYTFIEDEWNQFTHRIMPDVIKISLKILKDKAFIRLDYQKEPTIYEMNIEDINAFDFDMFKDVKFKRIQEKINNIKGDFGL